MSYRVCGYNAPMTESNNPRGDIPADITDVPSENIASRAADLLPEESAVGSDDPEAQAAAILLESEERTDDPNAGV